MARTVRQIRKKRKRADGARRPGDLSARVRANLQTLLERRFDTEMFLNWVAVAKL